MLSGGLAGGTSPRQEIDDERQNTVDFGQAVSGTVQGSPGIWIMSIGHEID